ncbi:MAG: helix-turn-helix domain-containing protein [Candidatus Nanohaloarchaea archaeon]
MVKVFRPGDSLVVDAEQLDAESLKALTDESRRKILEKLAERPSYPSEVAREMDMSKQKAHYHFEKLESAGLITSMKEEKKSGGVARYYRPASDAFALDLGTGGRKANLADDEAARKFLEPLVSDAELQGSIVVGSPDQHGPDQVRARDGHLAGEIGVKLGNYASVKGGTTVLDTEVVRDSAFDQNMVLLGGVLTNTVTKKFNSHFPARFAGEDFPYHEIETPENTYSDPNIGVIAKTENPESPGKSVFLVAGVRNAGTEAAVMAFKDLENLIVDYEKGDFYSVVRGRDMDGDGEIDGYEVRE